MPLNDLRYAFRMMRRTPVFTAAVILTIALVTGGVLRLIVGEGMQITLIGVCAGLLGSVALARGITSLVYGVPVRDHATFGSVAILLSLVALAACTIPALRAARVDPMVALGHE
jgi:ABC-type antimicrobial peptide transport system permease subunit